jgi:hypothetical protein
MIDSSQPPSSYGGLSVNTRLILEALSHLYTNPANHIPTLQADFFIGYNVGAITTPVKHLGASSCFANFVSHQQAQRAMEAMDGLPLLGREVEIELAQETTSVYDRKRHPIPVKPMVATPRDKSFPRRSS